MVKMNKEISLATMTALSVVTVMMMLTVMMNADYNNAIAKDERNQAVSQIEECGNGSLSMDILCQDLASELQGEENAIEIAGVQSSSDSSLSSTHPEPTPTPHKQPNVFYAVMDGSQIPESQGGPIDTPATGFAVFKLDKSVEEMSYKVYFFNFPEGDDVTAMHIHSGMPGEVGDHIVTLCGPPDNTVTCNNNPGLAVEGSFTPDNFAPPLQGQPMSALIEEIKQGNTYVNVHTVEHPDGEIRGQILVP
jgi:CHRD domain